MLHLSPLSFIQLLLDFVPFMLRALQISSFLLRLMGQMIQLLEPTLSHYLLLIKLMKYPELLPGQQVTLMLATQRAIMLKLGRRQGHHFMLVPQRLIRVQASFEEQLVQAMASPQRPPTPELQPAVAVVVASMQLLVSYQHSMRRFQWEQFDSHR
jgi:hypothetical protein